MRRGRTLPNPFPHTLQKRTLTLGTQEVRYLFLIYWAASATSSGRDGRSGRGRLLLLKKDKTLRFEVSLKWSMWPKWPRNRTWQKGLTGRLTRAWREEVRYLEHYIVIFNP